MTKKEINSKVKNFVFDLDGTLLTTKKVIDNSSIIALKNLQNKGKKIIFCTGRAWYYTKKYYSEIKPDYPIISCNGAMIYDHIKDEVVYAKLFAKSKIEQIIQILKEKQITFLIYTTEKMLGFSPNKTKGFWFNKLEEYNKCVADDLKNPINYYDLLTYDWSNLNNQKIVKFLLVKSDSQESNFLEAENLIKSIEDIYLVQGQKEVVDIMLAGFDKGRGLLFLKENYNLNLGETIAFGDAENDIPMFSQVKYSVAMGQADPLVKEAATFQTDSCDNKGIANFLKDE